LKKKLNIIIIGVGKMGLSHLKSFLKNNNRNIFLIEKNKNRKRKINNFLKKKNRNYLLTSSIPENKRFDFAIIATNPNERYSAVKNLVKKNKVKFLFLEKFLFNKASEYTKAQKIFREKKIKTYVNIWSKIFLKRLKIKYLNKQNLKINVEITKNSILTNLIHFYSIFRELNGKKIKINFDNLKINKKKQYTDGVGEIVISGKKKNEMVIVAKTSRKNFFSISFKDKKKHRTINYINGKLYEKSKKKYIDFPLASEVTSKFLDKLIKINKKNEINFPNYNIVRADALTILKNLRKRYKKNISIR
tara:strand:+ start:2964 stop:3875 length:912 start_codon:yes stop_codon:yes gene_type:complete